MSAGKKDKVLNLTAAALIIASVTITFLLINSITGRVTQEGSITSIIETHLNMTDGSKENVTLDAHPPEFELKSVRISGYIKGEGRARAYIAPAEAGEQRYMLIDAAPVTPGTTETPASTYAPPDLDPASSPEERRIITVLKYDLSPLWDPNNDGVASIEDGVVDFTVEGTAFNWEADKSKLCTKWTLRPQDTDQETTKCNGAEDCCAILVKTAPESPAWDEPAYIFYGKWGATGSNTVEAMVLYLNQSIGNDTYFESVVGEPASLPAIFIEEEARGFSKACNESCSLPAGLNSTEYMLEAEADPDVEIYITEIEYGWGANAEGIKAQALEKKKVRHSKFDGKTTNFDLEPDLANVSVPVLEKRGKGAIRWKGQGIDVSGADFDRHVEFGAGWVKVDGTKLNKDLDSPAEITLYSLPYENIPVVYSDGIFCADCNVIVYDDHELLFEVQHFTNYSAGANTNLTIWDQADTGMPYANQQAVMGNQVYFYANYTNITSGDTITGADCNITFNDTTAANMAYNATKALYEYNRTFSAAGDVLWNVTCNKTDYETLEATDNLTVASSAELLVVFLSLSPNPADTESKVTASGNISYANSTPVADAGVGIYLNGTALSGGADYGDGSDGSITVSSLNTTINNHSQLTGNEAQGDTTITLANAAAFSAGDEILIIQMQNSSAGTAGTYEFAEVQSKNSNNLVLTAGLVHSYYSGTFDSTTATSAQVVRIPQYTTVTVNNGASIAAKPWDGYSGGIIAFRATGTVTVQGTINASAQGFRGGQGSDSYQAGGNPGHGYQGESWNGTGSNTGAGAINPNGGGGGGGQYGPSDTGAGGGGASYGTQGTDGETVSTSLGGLKGLVYGGTDLSNIHLGAGGGGGIVYSLSYGTANDGGNGGGIVFIAAQTIDSEKILAQGQKGEDSSTSGQYDGAGGGGSGGSIYLISDSVTATMLNASGGAGGLGTGSYDGYGGNGGKGRIRLDYTTFSGATDPASEYNGTASGAGITTTGTGHYEYNLTSPSTPGNYNVTVNITHNGLFGENSTILQVSAFANYNSFDGQTTDFNAEPDLENVDRPVLENTTYGIIGWMGEDRNCSGADFDSNIRFGPGWVWVDTADLDQDLNSSANITLYGVSYAQEPVALADGQVCTDCYTVSYSLGSFKFNVSHFTNYSAGANTNLTIWDQADTGMPYGDRTANVLQDVYFYANYTNITSGETITAADCTVNFSDAGAGMTYNASIGLYQHNRTFNTAGTYGWNVTCNKTGYETLNASDNVAVTAGCDAYLDACKSTGWVPGTRYCVNTSIVTTGDCMVLGATNDNITIDCQGFLIDGDDGGSDYGIDVEASSGDRNYNLTVRNCRLQDFGAGIYMYYTNLATLWNNTINSSSNYGIYVYYSDGNNITGNTINSSGSYGIYTYYADYNRIIDNDLLNNGYGLLFSTSSDYETIDNNELNSSTYQGITFYSEATMGAYNMSGNMFDGRPFQSCKDNSSWALQDFTIDVDRTTNYGSILLWNCSNAVLRNVTVANDTSTDSGYGGILISRSNNVSILDSNLTDNYNGMRLDYAGNTTINNTRLYSNTNAGILFYSNSQRADITNNDFINNAIGIEFNYVSNSENRITSNEFNGSTSYDIQFDSIGYLNQNLSGNTADGYPFHHCYRNNSWSLTDYTITVDRVTNYGPVILYQCNNSYMRNITIANHASSSSSYGGLLVYYSNKTTLLDSNFTDNYNGINAQYSNNLTISNTTFHSNDDSGIQLYQYDNYANISSNRFTSNSNGAYIYSSNDANAFRNNTFVSNAYGIGIYASGNDNNIISDNTFNLSSTQDIYFGDITYLNQNLSGNTADGYPFHHCYRNNSWSLTDYTITVDRVTNYGPVILYQCNNSYMRNITIANHANAFSGGALTLYYSNKTTLLDSNISSNNNGIYLGYSRNTTVNNTLFYGNTNAGIDLYLSSPYGRFNHNKFKSNYYGLYIAGSGNDNNTFYDNDFNTSSNYDVYIASISYTNQNFTANRMDGTEFYQCYNRDGWSLSNYVMNQDYVTNFGPFFMYYCDNVTLENVTIINHATLSNNYAGLYLYYSHNVTVRNSNLSDNEVGLRLEYSDNATIENTTMHSNDAWGMFATYSKNTTIRGCNFTNQTGSTYGGIYFSSGNMQWTIINSMFNYNYYNLYFDASSGTGRNRYHNFTNNNFSNPYTGGRNIYIYDYNDDNQFTGNTIYSAGLEGIRLYANNDRNIFVENSFTNHSNGAYLQVNTNDNNTFYRNNFRNRTTAHAYSVDADNYFNTSSPLNGNYWDDYDTPGEGCNDVAPADGFCDSSKTLGGLGVDYKPYVNPITSNRAPAVTTPVFNTTTLYENQDIQANSTYTDDDNDPGNVTFLWYVENSLTYNHNVSGIASGTNLNSTLESGNYSKNQHVNVSVRAWDDETNSPLVWSATLNAKDPDSPTYSTFNGRTTDFDNAADLENIDDMTIENTTHGMIQWLQDGLNASNQDFDSNILFGPGWVQVNSVNLNPDLNSSANISLYSLLFQNLPTILADGAACTDCITLSYSGGNATFNATHFTNYSAAANAQLTIYDEYEGSHAEVGDNITFYANYTNTTSGDHIAGADCNVSFNDGTWSAMTDTGEKYNHTKNGGFATPGNRQWNVSCNKTGYETINLTDTVNVTDPNPPYVQLVSPTDGHISEPSVNLTCNATDEALNNITLWTNLTGTWAPYQTQTKSGTSAEHKFQLTGLSPGWFNWSCTANDTSGNIGNATENRTVRIVSNFVECGEVVSGPSLLVSDLFCSGTGVRLTTGGQLDCDGYTITGNNAEGYYAVNITDGADNIAVKNCIIRDFDSGIRGVRNSGQHVGVTITNNTITNLSGESAREDAIYISNVNNLNISGNRLTNAKHIEYETVYPNHNSNVRITGNNLTNSSIYIYLGSGVPLNPATFVKVTGMSVSDNNITDAWDDDAIIFYQASGYFSGTVQDADIKNNRIIRPGVTGIRFFGEAYNMTVADNYIANYTYLGDLYYALNLNDMLTLTGSPRKNQNCTIRNNTIENFNGGSTIARFNNTVIEDNIFNNATTMYIQENGNLTIRNSVFNNTQMYLHFEDQGPKTLQNLIVYGQRGSMQGNNTNITNVTVIGGDYLSLTGSHMIAKDVASYGGDMHIQGYNITISNCEASDSVSGDGMDVYGSIDMRNCSSHGHYYGMLIDQMNLTLTGGVTLYNNTIDLYHYNYNTFVNLRRNTTFNATNITILNPTGTYENYSVIDIFDNVTSQTAFYVRWSQNTSPLPAPYASFQEKFLEIAVVSGAVSIENFTWHWNESEEPGYIPYIFELWKYSTPTWSKQPAALDTTARTLTMTNMNPQSVYGILQQDLYVAEPECELNSTSFQNCSNARDFANITRVRVNCTSPYNVTNASFTFQNIDKGATFFQDGWTTDNSTGYFVYDNDDAILNRSGMHQLNATCQDNKTQEKSTAVRWPVYIVNITLVSPADLYYTSTGNATFVCNATSQNGLSNITLYTNTSGTWETNQTNIVTGSANQTEFNLTNILPGQYKWSCNATDSSGESDFATQNRTIIIINSTMDGCGAINYPGEYTLGADATGAPIPVQDAYVSYTCINISSSDVVFDCNGHSITNNGTLEAAGITMNGFWNRHYGNVTIKNCPSISGYELGITLSECQNSTIQNSTVWNSSDTGFYSSSSDWLQLNDLVAHSNVYGLYIYTTTKSNFTRVTMYNNSQSGLHTDQPANDLLQDCISYNNSLHGFNIGSEPAAVSLVNCTAYNNTGSGFYLDEDGNGWISDSTAHDNQGTGFRVLANTFYINNCTAYNNSEAFYLTNSLNLNMSNSTGHGSSLTGLGVYNSNNIRINNLHLYDNDGGDAEITTAAVAGTIIFNNVTFDNPSGSMENYTRLDLNDSMSANTGYLMNWTTNSTPAPADYVIFRNKFVEIRNLTSTVSIDSITWNWQESEIGSQNESRLKLLKYNVTGWHVLNSTPDTAANRLSLRNHNPASIYAILEDTSRLPMIVQLLAPEDRYNTTIRNITFQCNATTPANLTNITLYHNITGTWEPNQTNIVTGSANQTEFNLTDVIPASFDWNCNASDNESYSAFAAQNRSATVVDASIDSCRDIRISGTYKLNSSLNGATLAVTGVSGVSLACIRILASDVELDCSGNKIENTGALNASAVLLNGTSSSGLRNISVWNCSNITGYKHGIYSTYISNSSFTANKIINSTSRGFHMTAGSGSNITGNTVDIGNSSGFYIDSPNSTLRDNTASRNKDTIAGTAAGFEIRATYTLLVNNTADSNDYGFYIAPFPNATLVNNTARNSSTTGLYIEGATSFRANNTHLYMNGIDLHTYRGSFMDMGVEFHNLTIDRDQGDFKNYTSLDIIDVMTVMDEQWRMDHDYVHGTLPGSYQSMEGKFVNMSNYANGLIDLAIWRWTAAESTGKSESTFKVYNYSGGMWTETPNQARDTVMNTINITGLNASGTFGILHGNSPPAIINASNTPATPNISESVTIHVNVSDPDTGQTMNCTLSGNISGSNTSTTDGGTISINITVGALPAGNYTYNVTCNDTTDTDTDGPWNFTVTKTPTTCTLNLDKSSPQPYGTALNAECSCTSPEAGARLWRNDTDITTENNTPVVLAAGSYAYSCNVTESQNYTSASDTETFNITKNATVLNLTASPSWSETYGTQTTINCSADNDEVAESLYLNGSPVGIPHTQTLAANEYNYSCDASTTQNYTEAHLNKTLTIIQSADTLQLYLNGSADNLTVAYGVSTNATATSISGTEQLWRNSTYVGSQEVTKLAAGYYVYTANTTGNQNYTVNSTGITYVLNVTRAAPAITLLLNGTASNITVEYGTEVNISADILTGDTWLEMYLNSVLIESGTAPIENVSIFSTVGTNNATALYPASQNYTASQQTWFVHVQDTTKPAVTLVSPADGFTTADNNLTYRCNATDRNLTNMTLYSNTSGAWTARETRSVTGTSADEIFNETGLSTGNYSWNCLAYDSAGNSAWAPSNRSAAVMFVNTAPSITAVWAYPASPTTSDSVSIYVNVSDTDISQTMNCTLSGNLTGSNTATTNGGSLTITIPVGTLTAGNYSYNATCSDGYTNDTIAGTNFTVTQAAAPPPPPPGGGGGGGIPAEQPEQPQVPAPEPEPAPAEEPAQPAPEPGEGAIPAPAEGEAPVTERPSFFSWPSAHRPIVSSALVQPKQAVSCDPDVNIVEKERGTGDLSSLMDIPEGYEAIGKPFRADCKGGETFTTSIATPDIYQDVKVMRCSGGECAPQQCDSTQNLCGGKTPEAREEDIYRIAETPKITYAEADIRGGIKMLESGAYSALFNTNTKASISMPTEDVPQPENRNVRIVGTPMVLSFESRGEGQSAEVTLPYDVKFNDDERSVAVYAKTTSGGRTRWNYLGGTVDLEKKTVTTRVDLAAYAEGGTVTLAPITIYCPECGAGELDNRFIPSPDSRQAIILVHGLWSEQGVWDNLINDFKLSNQPYQIWTYTYQATKSLEESSKDFADYLEANKHRFDNTYFVGYSLGGLVTQKALRYAYEENQKDPSRYTFIKGVEKAVIMGSPNQGTPVINYLNTFISEFINSERLAFIPIHPLVKEILGRGVNLEPVPGISYYTIAGTKPYEFMQRLGLANALFGSQPNDGLIAVSSTQRFGNTILDQKCINFWSSPSVHTDLNDDPYIYKLLGQIVTSDISKQMMSEGRQSMLAGYTDYIRLNVEGCSPEDSYQVIGKKAEMVARPAYCACGNGVCDGLEDASTCPEDCHLLVRLSSIWWLILLIIILTMIIVTTAAWWKRRRKGKKMNGTEKNNGEKVPLPPKNARANGKKQNGRNNNFET